MACERISYLETPAREVGLKNLYLIYDYCEESHKAKEWIQNSPAEQVCLSGEGIYDDPSLLRKDDKDERLLSIFKQIHINLPFLEAVIHMSKGTKVLKDLLSHKEKLKKAASSVKLIKNALADLGAKAEEGRDLDEVRAVSFYPSVEPVEPLEWKALENRLKPSSVEPPKVELKELPEHLEYAFLQEEN
ncbi:hypothetical protein Tco_0942677 [Tanacetum coccineum]